MMRFRNGSPSTSKRSCGSWRRWYRQIARRAGGDVAVFASARKLATLIYRLLRWGQPHVDEGAAAYEKRHQEARIKSLTAAAKSLGFQLTPKASDLDPA